VGIPSDRAGQQRDGQVNGGFLGVLDLPAGRADRRVRRRPTPILDSHGAADTTIPTPATPEEGLAAAGLAHRLGRPQRLPGAPAIWDEPGCLIRSQWQPTRFRAEVSHYKLDA
jgi:hypothetical protein